MQIVRTIVWVLLLALVLTFTILNWDKTIDVRIWPGMVWDTRAPALAIVSFLLGLVPMWLVHRTTKWRATRRISALETATSKLASPAPTPVPSAPVAPPRTDLPPEPANPVDPEPSKPA